MKTGYLLTPYLLTIFHKREKHSGKSTYNSNKTDDPYNAKVYLDAEVFYEDNYNDFDGYEDAEDYYDEWGE